MCLFYVGERAEVEGRRVMGHGETVLAADVLEQWADGGGGPHPAGVYGAADRGPPI